MLRLGCWQAWLLLGETVPCLLQLSVTDNVPWFIDRSLHLCLHVALLLCVSSFPLRTPATGFRPTHIIQDDLISRFLT